MISSINIEGFRGFERFDMTNLGQVNLLVGKNNSGKTSILEALYLLSNRGDPAALWQLLWRRGERMTERSPREQPELDVSHLFTGHELRVGSTFKLAATNQTSERFVSFEIHEVSEKTRVAHEGISKVVLRVRGTPRPPVTLIPITRTGGISSDSLEPSRRFRRRSSGDDETPAQYITTESLDGEALVALWGKVALTPDEDLVLSALQCLEPEIERIAAQPNVDTFWGQARTGFIVKHRRYEYPIPIGTMGDGMWRILAMAIAITQCRNGVLLVDEIDTGLHHTVMSDMWKLIITAADRFDVQVFATTHSSECVRSLADSTAGQTDYLDHFQRPPNFTLQRIEPGHSRAVSYSAEEIRIAAEHEVEVR